MALDKDKLKDDIEKALDKEDVPDVAEAIAEAIDAYVREIEIKLKLSGKHKSKVKVEIEEIT